MGRVEGNSSTVQNGKVDVHTDQLEHIELTDAQPSLPDATELHHQPEQVHHVEPEVCTIDPPIAPGVAIPGQQSTVPIVVNINNNVVMPDRDGGYIHPSQRWHPDMQPPPQPWPQQVQPPPPSQPWPQQVQPPPQPWPQQTPLPSYPQNWTTGLFDCIDDPVNAIITLFCPCVTFGQVASAIDNGGTSCETAGCIYTIIALTIGMPCIYSCTYRAKLRHHYGLVEEPLTDCITHLCCEYCALCQEYRELNYRDLNPSASWMNINTNQNTQQQVNVPPPYQAMR